MPKSSKKILELQKKTKADLIKDYLSACKQIEQLQKVVLDNQSSATCISDEINKYRSLIQKIEAFRD